MTTTENGAIAYIGPSLLTGDPIVVVLTGLAAPSKNPKTGPMVQSWILCADMPPQDAVRNGLDDAVCGTCELRGVGGYDRKCYVPVWNAPNNVYKAFRAGQYREMSWPNLRVLLFGRSIRLGAYGDPAAAPLELWRTLLAKAAGHVGYTHAWRTCDPRLKAILMASVETLDDFYDAQVHGWRTFRIRTDGDPLVDGAEVVCPASDEAGHRTTCDQCELCQGQKNPARSVAIYAHGHNGVMTAFYRNRSEAMTA